MNSTTKGEDFIINYAHDTLSDWETPSELDNEEYSPNL